MDALGYVVDLPGAVSAAGGELVAMEEIEHPFNPLNPTWAHVVRPAGEGRAADRAAEPWACPVTRAPLRRVDHPDGGWWWSEESFLMYPVAAGIPLLTPGAAVFAARGGG
jgi:uncharacterized protein YbaR (Trm112 family)